MSWNAAQQVWCGSNSPTGIAASSEIIFIISKIKMWPKKYRISTTVDEVYKMSYSTGLMSYKNKSYFFIIINVGVRFFLYLPENTKRKNLTPKHTCSLGTRWQLVASTMNQDSRDIEYSRVYSPVGLVYKWVSCDTWLGNNTRYRTSCCVSCNIYPATRSKSTICRHPQFKYCFVCIIMVCTHEWASRYTYMAVINWDYCSYSFWWLWKNDNAVSVARRQPQESRTWS